jgi:NADP-dependent 3-hydroxy acid dehydrogenase YdfG
MTEGPDRAGGRAGGLARAVVLAALDADARAVAAGRDQERLDAAYASEPGVSTERVDLTDEGSIAALGQRLGSVDHVVYTASARARGRLADWTGTRSGCRSTPR